MSDFVRAFPLLDISIRSGGDGRTVEAYAAVWDTPVEMKDQAGTYREQIARSAFTKTVSDRGDKPWPVLYNHGMTLYGTPSERGSEPIGASIEPPRVDAMGLVTVSRYHHTESADNVLEAIRSGAVSAQSFSGRFISSNPTKPPRGGYRAAADGKLTLVTRSEIAMREYGPALFAAYPTAAITGTRAEEIAALLASIDPAERERLANMLTLSTRIEPDQGTDTTDPVAVVEEPLTHSSRHAFQRLRLMARQRGALV